jgi:predicted nucleic acid-binding protein
MSDDRVFLDSNIFIYMYDKSDLTKREASLSLLDSNACVASTQVINEVSSVLLRKIKVPIREVKQIINDIFKISDVKQIDSTIIYNALDLVSQYGYSYFDCLMLSSALDSGCKILYSEDMSDGQLIENTLTIVNPY